MPASQSSPAPPRPERRDQVAQLGVDRAAVVALVVVLQDHLPVRGDPVADPVPGAQLGQRVGGEPAVGPGQLGLQRGAVRAEPGEHESAPGGDGDRVQREASGVAAQLGQERRGAQRPVQAVGPAVVGAADRAAGAAAARRARRGLGSGHRDQPRAAVPAQVVEPGQPTGVPDHQDALPGHVGGEIVPGLGQGFLPPDAEPVREQDRLALPGELALGRVAGPGQAHLQRDLFAHRRRLPLLGRAAAGRSASTRRAAL